MCGIAGYIGTDPLPGEIVRRTLSLMMRRGPDGQASYSCRLGARFVELLHSRLAILDLDPRSNQPFHLDGYTIVFNGEIYNYIELQKELRAQGVTLTTDSDTEVLLHYYRIHGPKCTQYFEGMWSFAIHDPHTQHLFLSRDRFGEKPLYLLQLPQGIAFGSEVKCLESLANKKLSVNEDQIERYLVYGFRSLYQRKETFYRGVTELPAGTSMTIDSNGTLSEERYWSPHVPPERRCTDEEAVEVFRETFERSLKLRLRSDVPLAFCLSGGVDSSAIVCTAAKRLGATVSTFSILDKDPRYDERKNIATVVNDVGSIHHSVELSTDGFFDRLRGLIDYHDGPLATISYYAHSFLSELIGKHGFKVALSGTGADEMLTGYYDHHLLHLHEMRQDSSRYQELLRAWNHHVKPLTRNSGLQDPELYLKDPLQRDHLYLDWREYAACLQRPFTQPYTEFSYTESLLKNRMLNELFTEIVPVILHEDDCNSMLYSVENRSPFLDTNLFSLCFSFPPSTLIKDGYAKRVLREAMKGTVPDAVRLDREKRGFNASLNSVVNFTDPNTREFLLASSPVWDYVRRDQVIKYFDINPLPNSHSKFLFNVINLKLFLELRAAL